MTKEEIKSDVAASSQADMTLQQENWFVKTKPRGKRGEPSESKNNIEVNPKEVKSINE
jgi:hypothetical protein